MSSPDPSAEVQLAVLEERTKVTLTKMGEIVAKLDGLVEQVMEIRSSMPTWQVELQRVADRQSMNETRISVLEGTLSDRLHSLEMKDGNRDAREGVFIAIMKSPMAVWIAGAIAFGVLWFERKMG